MNLGGHLLRDELYDISNKFDMEPDLKTMLEIQFTNSEASDLLTTAIKKVWVYALNVIITILFLQISLIAFILYQNSIRYSG